MTYILLHNMMVQEQVNSDKDEFNNFCGMYDPDECQDDNGILGDDDKSVLPSDGEELVDDDAAQHVQRIEAEVSCQTPNRHIYDSVVEHEQL